MHKTMLTEEKIREILNDKAELDSVAFFDKYYEYLDEHLDELLTTWLQHEKLIDTMLSNKPATVYIVD